MGFAQWRWKPTNFCRKITGICRIRLSDGKYHSPLELVQFVMAYNIFCPNFFSETKSPPRIGPTGIESYMGKHLRNFMSGDAVRLGKLQVMRKRGVDDTLANKGGDGNHTTVTGRKTGTVPHFPEENVIIQFGKLGSKITQCSATCCLSYFSCAIIICVLVIESKM